MFYKKRSKRFSNQTKKTNKKFKIIFLLITTIFLIFGLYFVFNQTDFFRVKYFEISQEKINCINTGQLKAELIDKEYNLFLLTETEIKNNFQQRFLCLSSVNLKKSFPDKAFVHLIGREAMAVISSYEKEASVSAYILPVANDATPSATATSSAFLDLSKGEERYLVDKDGVVFSKTSQMENLPTIFLPSKISLGKKISEAQILKTLEVVNKLTSFNLLLKDLRIVGQDTLFVNSNPFLVFNLEKDIKVQLASLQLILDKAKMNEESIEFIDLRFDKPIIRIASKKKDQK